MITDAITALGGWSWWILGLVLLALEVVLPGTFFLWFGVSALIIGISAVLIDWPWQFQLVGFVVLALVLVVVGRRYFNWADPAAEQVLNQRANRLVGNTYVLAEPIVDGRGRVRIDDTTWRITGPDLPSGSRVRVVGVDGALLHVEAEA
jgi:membrane protein implicated in regulation of membrane protease activity